MGISIRAPLAGSDNLLECLQQRTTMISIRAPLAGSDMADLAEQAEAMKISIRAPLAGSDSLSVNFTISEYNFNPRSPCGERRAAKNAKSASL